MRTRSHGGLLAVAALVVGLALTSTAGGRTAELGVYAGPRNPGGVSAFQSWLGQPVRYAVDFLDPVDWRQVARPWALARWSALRRKGVRLVLGVPLVTWRESGAIAHGSVGRYDRYFRSLAKRLRAAGLGDSILRLGWEFNGGWYAWSVHDEDDARSFVRYWRRVVEVMRAVAPRLQFDWNPSWGWHWVDPEHVYPGDAYVDYVGLDVYDQAWLDEPANAETRWNHLLTAPFGLEWHRDFAAAHGKPMTFPEWGLTIRDDGAGGGDAPLFIMRMKEWIKTNNVAYHAYFNFDAPDGRHALGPNFPAATETFRLHFGPDGSTGVAPSARPSSESRATSTSPRCRPEILHRRSRR